MAYSPIFLHGCEIKSGRGRPEFEEGLGSRLQISYVSIGSIDCTAFECPWGVFDGCDVYAEPTANTLSAFHRVVLCMIATSTCSSNSVQVVWNFIFFLRLYM